MHFQRIGVCAAVLFLMMIAGVQVSSSRPLARGSAEGGFLLAGQGPAAEEAAQGPAGADSVAVDSLTADSSAVSPARTKNPTGALLRSLALPGWGQLYNEQYIKSALVLAAEGLLVAGAVVEHRRAGDDHDVYRDLSRPETVRQAAWNRYSRRIDKRNAYLWYYAGLKFLSAIDAYVDAHLYRFDEGPFSVEARVDAEAGPRLALMVRCDL